MDRTIASSWMNHYSLRLQARMGRGVTPMPLRFPDSANWLWRSQGQVFKLARIGHPPDHFWHGARALFGLDRQHRPELLMRVLDQLPHDLPMPAVPMHWQGFLDGAPLWSQPFVGGDIPQWSACFAGLLARQCSLLQRRRSSRFGCFVNPAFTLLQWPSRLQRYLAGAIGAGLLPVSFRQHLQCLPAPPTSAVPLLLDMRNDQFIETSSGCVWLDWEAMTWAPVEFALALIEITIPEPVRAPFMRAFRMPPRHRLEAWRQLYRAAFFVMGALGECQLADIDAIDSWLPSGQS